MKIEWPWTVNKERINSINHEVQCIKQALINARVANFIMVKTYKRGDEINYDQPASIELESLLERIESLESNLKSQGNK